MFLLKYLLLIKWSPSLKNLNWTQNGHCEKHSYSEYSFDASFCIRHPIRAEFLSALFSIYQQFLSKYAMKNRKLWWYHFVDYYCLRNFWLMNEEAFKCKIIIIRFIKIQFFGYFEFHGCTLWQDSLKVTPIRALLRPTQNFEWDGSAACTRQPWYSNGQTPVSTNGLAESVWAAPPFPDAATRSPSFTLHPGQGRGTVLLQVPQTMWAKTMWCLPRPPCFYVQPYSAKTSRRSCLPYQPTMRVGPLHGTASLPWPKQPLWPPPLKAL